MVTRGFGGTEAPLYPAFRAFHAVPLLGFFNKKPPGFCQNDDSTA